MVTYTRTKNLRAQVPSPRRPLRRFPDFYKCNRRSNYALCLHSNIASTYSCHVTGASVNSSQHITCQSSGVYMIRCVKTTGPCSRLNPTYIGITGEGEDSRFTHRLGQHLGSATQPGQADTIKTIGRHFRLPGNIPDRDMVMLPLEIVSGGLFLRQSRERL